VRTKVGTGRNREKGRISEMTEMEDNNK